MITKFKIFEDSAYRGIASGDIVGFKYSQPDIDVEISIPILYKHDGEFNFEVDDIEKQFKGTKNKNFNITYDIIEQKDFGAEIFLIISFITYNERVVKSILTRAVKSLKDKYGEDIKVILDEMTINGEDPDIFYNQFKPKKIGF